MIVWEGRYESYLTDPDEEPDPAEWTTEIAYLVRDDLSDGVDAPTWWALAGAGCSRLDHLADASEAEIGVLHGIGPSVLETLGDALVSAGLDFDDGGSPE